MMQIVKMLAVKRILFYSQMERCGTAFSWWVIIFLVILQHENL